jgi:hypothetical protein
VPRDSLVIVAPRSRHAGDDDQGLRVVDWLVLFGALPDKKELAGIASLFHFGKLFRLEGFDGCIRRFADANHGDSIYGNGLSSLDTPGTALLQLDLELLASRLDLFEVSA